MSASTNFYFHSTERWGIRVWISPQQPLMAWIEFHEWAGSTVTVSLTREHTDAVVDLLSRIDWDKPVPAEGEPHQQHEIQRYGIG